MRRTRWSSARGIVVLVALVVAVTACDGVPPGPAQPGTTSRTEASTEPTAAAPQPATVELLPVAQSSDEALPSGLPGLLLLPADYEVLAATQVGDASLLVLDAGPGGMAVFDANSATLVARGWALDREVLTDDLRTLVAVRGGTQVSLSAVAADGVRLTYQVVRPASPVQPTE